MRLLSASEARDITNQNLLGPAIEPFLDLIMQEIETTASSGKCVIDVDRWLETIGRPQPTFDELDALRRYLERYGFQWKNHSNPDPLRPGSRSYRTLSW